MSFWSNSLGFGRAKAIGNGHLRVSELGDEQRDIDHEVAPEGDGVVISVGANDERPLSQRLGEVDAGRAEQYSKSIQRIEAAVYLVAGAVASLDSLEIQIVRAKAELERLRLAGEPVDIDKVHLVVQQMVEHVANVVGDFENGDINLLRDARLQVRFVTTKDLDRPVQDYGLDLTLIALDNLAALHVRAGRDPVKLERFLDGLHKIVHSNIHILSSLILALFASRDYTNEVTRLALDMGVLGQQERRELPSLADLKSMNEALRRKPILLSDATREAGERLRQQCQDGRSSLLALLEPGRTRTVGS
ncbi:MAG: hypothetical protein GC150_12340 [Rhizobiales bacterium]|nr:hypothetical protein [Hyphomicrobiales bacterium]